MKVGYCQYCPEFKSADKNVEKVQNLLSDVEADIVVLPELAFSGYLFENREELKEVSQEIGDSRTIESLVDLCRQKNMYLVTGFAERAGDKLFNSALTLGPAGLIQTYRKIHLFNIEKEYFDPGDTQLSIVEIGKAKVGVMVCFDWVFPEVARTLALKGADIICHPSNLVLNYCQKAMVTRSLENSVFSITANRTGSDKRPQGEVTFTGQSQILDPKGECLANSTAYDERVVIVDIDPTKARDKAITPNNDLLADRRPELYSILG
jgi:predicted amidohydrolase